MSVSIIARISLQNSILLQNLQNCQLMSKSIGKYREVISEKNQIHTKNQFKKNILWFEQNSKKWYKIVKMAKNGPILPK